MKTTLQNSPLPNCDEHEELIGKQASTLSHWKANWAASKVAADGLKQLRERKVQSLTNLGVQAINLAETALSAAQLANALPAIGALSTQANAATAAVDQSLTNASVAEFYTHMSNRSNNMMLTQDLLQAGKITTEEATILNEMASEAAINDIQRSRERMLMAKDTVASLHEHAIKQIHLAKTRLQ